ncbi:uncharacterized protein LOC123559936 [Mercenaria mercenaria]|uniref:uncharacterized protein LOC123559936 n=1 Tax=Mercenaria mercenaria TaxID=6596 RepID=UPI00234F6147|nr:uncharacterized protein LOC123559936 [Mercenaria mercenaria]
MEMLGVQSMEAEYEKALSTAESLDCILSSENQSKDISLIQSTKVCKRKSQSTDDQLCKSSVSQAENFGFEDLATSTVKPSAGSLDKTPERLYKKEELDSEKKNKMKKLKAPNCSCMVADCDQCPDLVRHRLCMKAGIVLSDFLAQTDMRSAADILLTDMQSKFEILSDICSDSTNSLNDFGLPNEKSLVKNGHIHDPQLLYTCLEAGCIKAESYLHQKDFNKVHQVWKTFQNLEKSGSLKNVLHSNILLTRLALCDASGYMLSLHEPQTKLNQSETGSRINQSDIDKKMEDTTQKLENLSIKPRRKVSFEGEDESWTITGTCMKIAKKITKFAEDMMSPVAKSVMDSVNTPKSQFIAKKSKVALTTPATNRMMVLEQLMASDEEDDMLVFPEPKPVTPRVAPKSSKSSRIKSKCKTEPRNPSSKKPAFTIAEDPVDEKSIACKLNFPAQTSDDMSGSNTVDNSHVEQIKRKPRKMKKEKCSSTSAINDTEGQTDEDVDSKDKTRKSGIPKRSGRKPVGDKIKNVEKSTENSIVMLNADESNKTGNSINVLREKGADGDTGQLEKLNSGLNQIKNDVFDFGLEASPVVAKVSKTGRGKQTKGSQRGKKASGVPRKPSNEDEQNVCMEVDNKENESIPKAKTSSRRGRPKRGPDNTEMVRKNSDELDECELEISLEELTLDDDRYSDIGDNDTERARDVSLPEPVIEQGELVVGQLDDIEVKLDIDLEPIEIMRGETVPKSKAGNKSRKRGKAVAAKADDAYEEDTVGTTESKKEEGSSSGEDSHDTSRTVEKMRSGRLASMNELTHMDLMDEPRVSCVEMDASEDRSPCGSDIISALECLYERLCKFPPNPQHSDVCHMLALHYLDTDPQRAAFLLSDAMAVTFRHQVLLNLGRKAKRESKSSCASVSKAGHVQDGMLFSGDDLKLSDMVKSIPEDWCVVQLSVVSVGLPWKQMILTRFVKDEEPVILKLPGFSSPQGRHILKDFSTLLEQNADSAKIESTTEWWSTRRKLDTDMENLVDRIEKHWLGCWRCAVLPGEFSEKTLDLACNDVNKITKKVVTRKDIELLLLAHKAGTEKEIGQCITDILGVHSSNIDSIVSILKKYSNKGTDKKDNQHKILILDKTVQHLPWESIPILSDKSVSRMPCLSHMVTQLNNLQTQKKSVFLKGVNPRNTFYILNPDSDLPRTQDFFKDWFESEKGWTGVIGCRPSSEQFIDALTNKDFLIFCGHGSGGRIFSSDEIEKLTARAVTMLMGCSSGRLLVKGQLEPSGMMISYFLAGCPSMVANLWDVTDKDIDKFTENLIKTWMSSNHGTYLTKLVQSSRAVCKLKYLNGLAPVVYGLPVFINKGKK